MEEAASHRLDAIVVLIWQAPLRQESLLRRATNRLLKVRMCIGVVQLHSADSAHIVVVACDLWIRCMCAWEGGTSHKLIGLLIQIALDNIHTEQHILDCRIRF